MNDFNEKETSGQSQTSAPETPSQPEQPRETPDSGDSGGEPRQQWTSGQSAPPPNPGQQQQQQPYGQGYRPPAQQQQYRPPYGNTYPPNQNQGAYQPPSGQGQQGYGPNTGGYNRNAYPPPPNQNAQNNQYNPHHYNPNSGWQTPRKPDQYEWKFEDYEQLDVKKEKKKRSRGLVVFTVCLLCLLSVGLVALAGVSIYTATVGDAVTDVTEGDLPGAGNDAELEIIGKPEITETLPVGGKMTIPEVAKAVSPSVVGVIQYSSSQFLEVSGMGSGIIMSDDGYIITNAHVVEDSNNFKVILDNGDPYDAELIGADRVTDLAVLKISATDLTPAQFGDSDELEVGETVVAIGNPAGIELAGSVTQGIVSAVNREVRTPTYSMTYIQTDAAINPGNSGGALVNEYGQVIGINSSKVIAEGYEGIGFAIPITVAKPVIDDIITNGRVTGRVVLGITCYVVDEVDARYYELQMGLAITDVDPNSDLYAKGVQRGDILTEIDGERVYDLDDVRRILDRHVPGDSVTLKIYRKIGTTREDTFEVEIELMEEQG